MAKAIFIESGSLLCGSPIMVSVTSETAGSRATFHRVKLVVKAALSTDSVYEIYTLSAPVGDYETIRIDISTALASVASKFVYEYLTAEKTYPYLTYTLKTFDEYMIDGILYEKVGERDYGSSLSALMGEFTDIERYLSITSKAVQKFSRKPSVGEVCATNELLLHPVPLATPASVGIVLTTGPTVEAHSLSALSGKQTFNGHSVYVVPPSPRRMQFQFVNKLGVVESISADMRKALSYETTTETDTVSAPGSFRPNRRMLSRKGKMQQQYAMTSGAVSQDWANWWINEFLHCEKGTWIKLDGIWIPCEVAAEDTITVYDESENEMCSISFSVRLSLSGGFCNRL